MKILIATPLFPPETGPTATYSFAVAKRLASKHDVTVLTYANHTESLEGVRVRSVSKNKPLLVRLYLYTRALVHLSRRVDVVFAQRAVAAGLPAIIAKFITKTPVVIYQHEDEAWE